MCILYIVLIFKKYLHVLTAVIDFCKYICNYTVNPTLFKIKVLHDAIEEPFCLNGSIKNL